MMIAIDELAGCSRCTISVLDLDEQILDLVVKAKLVRKDALYTNKPEP